jgi:stage II sporulation protein D
MQASKKRAYDVDATVLSQVYHGVSGEAASTRRAVEDTDGKVLTYRGKVIEAYFHSTCGGRTEDGRSLWGGELDYLSTVKDPYCEAAPDFFWIYRISPRDLGAKLGMAAITEVQIEGRAKGGRALKLSFLAGAKSKTLDGDAVRRAVGYAKLKSTLFHVSAENGKFVFKGSGSGHGVGMCQWGARTQAEQGRSYRDILKFYFPEADLDRI